MALKHECLFFVDNVAFDLLLKIRFVRVFPGGRENFPPGEQTVFPCCSEPSGSVLSKFFFLWARWFAMQSAIVPFMRKIPSRTTKTTLVGSTQVGR